jgi:hypothetical protein
MALGRKTQTAYCFEKLLSNFTFKLINNERDKRSGAEKNER